VIDNNTIKYWFRNKLDAAGFNMDQTAVAYENRDFDSSNADMFFRERFAVVTESPSTNEASMKSGIMWYDVIVNRAAGTDTMDTSAAALASVFEPDTNKDQVVQSGLKIDIDLATTQDAGPFDEARYMVPVRIEFRAYKTS